MKHGFCEHPSYSIVPRKRQLLHLAEKTSISNVLCLRPWGRGDLTFMERVLEEIPCVGKIREAVKADTRNMISHYQHVKRIQTNLASLLLYLHPSMPRNLKAVCDGKRSSSI